MYEHNKSNLPVTLTSHIATSQNFIIQFNTDNILLLHNNKDILLDSVSIKSYRNLRGNNNFSYSIAQVKGLSSVLGEDDIMRYIGILPGVSQGMEGGLGYFVRGAGNGNNRTELDNVPIYGTTHLLGLVSVFHPSTISHADFQMGGIASSSANVTASLLQVHSHSPDLYNSKYDFSISPILADMSVSGFIKKNKLGYQVASRYSLLPIYAGAIANSSEAKSSAKINVGDVYFKLHYQINPKNKMDGFFLKTTDRFYFKLDENDDESSFENELGWQNTIAKLDWQNIVNAKTYFNLSAYTSSFSTNQFNQEMNQNKPVNRLEMKNHISDNSVKGAATILFNKLKWQPGIQYNHVMINPATQKNITKSKEIVTFDSSFATNSVSAFTDIAFKNEFMEIKGGIRLNYFTVGNYATAATDIRLKTSLFLTPKMGVEATYDNASQLFHVLEGLPIGWSLDVTIPASQKFVPERVQQFYTGLFYGSGTYYATIGAYYKTLSNILMYKNTTKLFGVKDGSWEDEITAGKGLSKGIEVWIEKRNRIFNWSVAYTLSKTDRTFDEINKGKTFPFKFDRRHILNVQSKFITLKTVKKEKSLYLSVNLSSGNKLTIPVSKYEGVAPPYWSQKLNSQHIPLMMNSFAIGREEMSTINQVSNKNYFRIDIGYSILKHKKKIDKEFSFGFYNVTNRHNPYLQFNENGKWKELSIFPIVPYIKWKVAF